ncbi:MAG TPA: intradiol ring-cleavage dioxygenase [Pseudonocardia sp.]|nr:intradiol ring-cleavage dioxygenase [Pseudonocardia sp.]
MTASPSTSTEPAATQADARVSPAQAAGEQAVTDEVVASFASSKTERYRELMTSLVRHLHGFARDVRLTHEEWEYAVEFLTRTGHISDDRRQEFILLSDVLGLSMLTVGINAPTAGSANAGATESTVFGPFFVDDAPEVPLGGDLAQGAKGVPCYVSGQVRGVDGTPLAGVRVDAWEADEDGFYDTQYEGVQTQGRGWQRTGEQGEYRFWSVLPTHYPIPDDGPVGELIRAAGRGPMRPAHLHFKVTAPGYRTLITHVFVDGDEYLHNDVVFGVKDSLIGEFARRDGGTAPDGTRRDGQWAQVEFDLVLAREETG